MPRSAALVLALAALVAAGAFAYRVLTQGASGPAATAEPDAATVAALRDLTQRLDRLEHEVFQPRLAPTDPAARLADLERRLRDLERRPEAGAPASAPANEASTNEPPPPLPRPQSLSDEDLLLKARGLARKQARDAAAPYWRELLARNPSDELFVEGHIELAYAYRAAKDHVREEEALREALHVAGEDTTRGQEVLFQLAWTATFRGDTSAARELMIAVANAPSTSRALTGHARLNVAHLSLQLNDGERAREALQSMLRDFGDSEIPMEAWLARQATERLEQLK